MEIFWVNYSGHFLMVIKNSANTVGQPSDALKIKPTTVVKH